MKRLLAWLFLFVFVTGTIGYADEGVATADQIAEIEKMLKDMESEYKDKLESLEEKISTLESCNKELQNEIDSHSTEIRNLGAHPDASGVISAAEPEQGNPLIIGFAATNVVQSLVSGGNVIDESRVTDSTYTVDLSIEKGFEHGSAFALIEAGEGSGLDGEELSTFSAVNRDVGASSSGSALEVTEAWYEHYFLDNTITTTVGKLDSTNYMDGNEYAHDETTQFLSTAFRDNPAVESPDGNAYGARVAYAPVESVEFDVGALDDNADFEDIADELFLYGQVNIKPNLMDRPGNYRFYGWHDDSKHTVIDNTERIKSPNYGFGLSFDQELTDGVGAFSRLGWADPDVSTINWHWSLGTQFSGMLWNRENDIFAIAVGQNHPGDAVADSGVASSPEGHLEMYYNFALTDYLTLSPHYQLIWNPLGVGNAGQGDDAPISIISLRSQLNF